MKHYTESISKLFEKFKQIRLNVQKNTLRGKSKTLFFYIYIEAGVPFTRILAAGVV